MKLNRLFALSLTILALLSGALLARILWGEWNNYGAARDGLRTMQLARGAMIAAEKLSFERGPVNGMLGDDLPHQPERVERLARARQLSDQALAQLRTAIGASDAPSASALDAVRRSELALAAARQEVDRLAALPRPRRSAAELTAAVEQMFALVPVVMETVNEFSRNSERIYPRFSVTLLNARFAVELREYAGRLGSQLTAALTARSAISPAAQREIVFLQGRIEQLRQLIKLPTNAVAADTGLLTAVQAMDRDYFGSGLQLVAEVVEASASGQPYRMDTAQFAERYVPSMTPILQVRDALLGAALDDAEQAFNAARQRLLLASLTGAMMVLALTLLLTLLRQRVIVPLLAATRALIKLGNGDFSAAVGDTRRADEVGDLLRALGALRAGAIDKQRLEHERQHLIDELKRSADTDYLTGILNRRAFAAAGNLRIRGAREQNASLAVILFDIDYFKSVNDLYGHDAGDQVLIRIARLARQELRDGEILARYGGEEFVVMPGYCELDAALAVAERLRVAIEAEPHTLADGHILRVTASFGVAVANGAGNDLNKLFHAADVALYHAKSRGRNRVES